MSLFGSPEQRIKEHQEWCETIRDPAFQSSEGIRRIEEGPASVEYEIAPLPDGRWAVRYECSCGISGVHCPWNPYPTREDALDAFLAAARAWFEREAIRSEIKDKMLRALSGGLFGFLEPNIDQKATEEHREIIGFIRQEMAKVRAVRRRAP